MMVDKRVLGYALAAALVGVVFFFYVSETI